LFDTMVISCQNARCHVPEDQNFYLHRYDIHVSWTELNSVACSPQANYTDRAAAAC
jgi:hypothetical protein